MKIHISKLKIQSEDDWMDEWIKSAGDSIRKSLSYQVYDGHLDNFIEWCKFIDQSWQYRMQRLMSVYVSIQQNGQLWPIKIYGDNTICDGHKRSAAMLHQGYEQIQVNYIRNQN